MEIDPGLQVKQVIVMRTDLNMRKGKMIAQGAHASMMFLVDSYIGPFQLRDAGGDINPDLFELRCIVKPAEIQWLEGKFTKVCVRVDSEDELFDIHEAARNAGLESYLVRDSGLTEFGGIPTYTCCAIGPDHKEAIDAITGHLKLL